MNPRVRRILTCCITSVWLGLVLAACGSPTAPVVPGNSGEAQPDPTSVRLLPVTLTVPPTQTAPPAETSTPVPTLDPGANDPDYYYGGLVITIDNVGETLVMQRKGSFLLELGENYVWRVALDPPGIVTLNPNIALDPGEQGLFVAREKGQTTLRAVGDPACRLESPPCARPSILFSMTLIVE